MTVGCKIYQRGEIPAMVSQCWDGPQKEWKRRLKCNDYWMQDLSER
jgi:hypothetical protein